MSVLFIGGVFAEENQKEIIENTKGYAEFSANIFQKKLINGFKKNNQEITVISAPFIGSYPNRYKRMSFRGFKRKQKDFEYVNFNNIWGFRNFSRAKALKKRIKKLILKDGKEFNLIVIYSAHEPFLEAGVYAKSILPNSKICFVVPDLPQYMNLEKNKTKIYDVLKKYDIKKIEKLTENVDSFVVLTEEMKEPLHIGNRRYMVVEGIIDELPEKKPETVDSLKNIVYTGKLNFAFGIEALVEAFKKLDDTDCRLILCGDGDAKSYVIDEAVKDRRIEYKGQISPEQAKEITEAATVLVNPRSNSGEYTKYSFPSKNIEYLLSGRTVVAYMLDGMPKIYSNFIEPIQDEQSLTETLRIACSKDNSEKYRLFLDYAERNLVAKNVAKNILNF